MSHSPFPGGVEPGKEASPVACPHPPARDGAELAPILYARAGGPPDDWYGLRAYDLETGAEVTELVEVDVPGGWVLVAKRNAAGEFYIENGDVATERREGRFEIRRPAP